LTRSRENTSIVDCEETAETWTPFDGKPITGYEHSFNKFVLESIKIGEYEGDEGKLTGLELLRRGIQKAGRLEWEAWVG
jgi:hypothetical protein